MDQINFLTLIPYVFITTFTPGPNNISCAASSARWGLRRTWGYLLGIGLGFFVILLLSGAFSGALIAVLPWLESYMRWIGATYILWLAYGSPERGAGRPGDDAPRGFRKGFMPVRQQGNPFRRHPLHHLLGPILAHRFPSSCRRRCPVIGFTSVMSWAVFGLNTFSCKTPSTAGSTTGVRPPARVDRRGVAGIL